MVNIHLLAILLLGALLYNVVLILLIPHLYSRGLNSKSTDKIKKIQINARNTQKIVTFGGIFFAILAIAGIFMPATNKEINLAISISGVMACMSCRYMFKRVEVMSAKELNKRNVKEEE